MLINPIFYVMGYGYNLSFIIINTIRIKLKYTDSASLTVAVLLSAEEFCNLTQRLEDYNYSEH